MELHGIVGLCQIFKTPFHADLKGYEILFLGWVDGLYSTIYLWSLNQILVLLSQKRLKKEQITCTTHPFPMWHTL